MTGHGDLNGKRMLRALRGETTDRPPFWLMRQAGRYLPEYRAVRKDVGGFLDLCLTPELAVEVTLQPIRRYGMDAAILFSDILVVPFGLGQDVAFKEGEGPVLEPVRSVTDLEALEPSAVVGRTAPVMETVRRLAAALPPEVTLIGFAGSPWTVATYMVEGRSSREFTVVKNWAFADPVGFGRLIDILVEATTEYLSAQIVAGAETVQLFDSWAGVLPEAAFRKWVIEPTRTIVDRLHARHPGVPVIGFPRGAGLLYPTYVAETGVDAVSLDTTVPAEAGRTLLQSRKPVQGNLDPLLLVCGGPALDDGVRGLLAAYSGGPYIFNLGHGIVPQTPPEHVARLADLVRGTA